MSLAQDQAPAANGTISRYLLLGTAGHIDHGKTSLIKALTGIDTDRLPEEKQRGMTIDLGFAHLEIESGGESVRFGIVDVPGHERFVRTMVAGATGIDMVMLIVAADDSVMPQTREHIDILRLLDVQHGLVAVTKIDLVDQEMVELVTEEVHELLQQAGLESFPVLAVSSVTGAGLPALKAALLAQARAVQARPAATVFRLPIDRVFTIHGRGTVVTGSAICGTVSVGDALEVMPGQRSCKVRGLQSHFDQADTLHLGQRVAINLTGIEKDEVHRGDELATPGYLSPTTLLDAALHALPTNAKPIRQLQRVRLCIGTREELARIRLLEQLEPPPSADRPDGGRLPAGGLATVQLLTDEPVAAEWGQHYIIRDETDSRTLGGGSILRPLSRKLRKSDHEDIAGLKILRQHNELDRLEEIIRFQNIHWPARIETPEDPLALSCRSGVAREDIPARLDALQQEDRILRLGEHGYVVARRMLQGCRQQALEKLRHYHTRHPDDPGYPLQSFVGWLKRRWGELVGEQVFGLLQQDEVKVLGQYCCLTEFAPKMSAEDERLLKRLVEEYYEAAFQPPAVASLKCAAGTSKSRIEKLMKIATATGELVRVNRDIILNGTRVQELKERLAREIERTGGLTVADVRTLLDSSRKFVVPLLEYLDKTGFTQRTGDQRVLA